MHTCWAGRRRKLGLEYVLLSLQGVHAPIEPWTSTDSLTWLKIMAQDLGANMRREMYSMDIIQQVGLARDAGLLRVLSIR